MATLSICAMPLAKGRRSAQQKFSNWLVCSKSLARTIPPRNYRCYKESVDAVYDHKKLLDALVPVVQGKKFLYNEYIDCFFEYDPLLRSVPGGSKEEIMPPFGSLCCSSYETAAISVC